ncbi:MAG: YtxH domain-containing protein [Desulfurivibrionaceae bacterium]
MNAQQLITIGNKLKEWFFLLKSDPEAFAELRKLFLGILVCLAILYGGSTLFLAPQKKELRQKLTQKTEIESTAPVQMASALAAQVSQLEIEQKSLQTQTETLALQIRLIEEQWHSLTDREQFSKTLFTLQTNAPINMENHLRQMSQLEDRSVNGFTLNTVSLAGEVPFPELYRYLQYIEGRPEIGIIEDLAVERLKSAGYDQQAKVKFSMVVGRTTLDKP